ncbi:MAG: hypothetical protein LBH40_00440 [Alphaproteobacteria bacterium]|jgi:galactitol-specific phosphotransferase system IIB component|nr:hypothetical protein [Alphaproteobacteria bacterium]
MKILGIYEKKEDGMILVHHVKSAIRDLGLINIEVDTTATMPQSNEVANLFVMNRELASKSSLANIMIVENTMDYADIKEKLKKTFIIYGLLDFKNY